MRVWFPAGWSTRLDWRIGVNQRSVVSLWYLLNAVNGIGYMVLIVLLAISVCLLLRYVEGVAKPRKGRSHRFVHPFPGLVESRNANRHEHNAGLSVAGQSNRRKRATTFRA